MSRVVVALILAPIVIAMTWLSGWYFMSMILIFSTLLVLEAAKVVRKSGVKTEVLLLIPANIAIQLAVFFQYWIIIPLTVFAMITLLFVIEIIKGNPTGAASRIGGNLLVLVVSGLTAFMTMIEFLGPTRTEGKVFLLTLFVGVWSFDIFSYYGGKLVGRHKLIPKISPGKTWEGLIIGAFLGITLYVVAGLYLIPPVIDKSIDLINLCAGGIIVVIASLVGDLSESVLKRDANMKDSGKILIGHGGVLDRLDSLLFAAPALYFFLEKTIF
jgi:phosphatidate cytidylyltransferase